MKDILIITSYFPPEIGAASNRIFHLCEGLSKRKHKVSVLTPLPNYPTGKIFDNYKNKVKTTTEENNITVNRLWIYASNSKNKLLRLFSMLSYSFSLTIYFVLNKIPNTVIIQSPPLLVAFTGIFFLKRKKRKLILNVSDLWPIAGLELGALQQNFNYKLLENIEAFNYKNADLILGQSEEIITHINRISPKTETFLYRNYPDIKATTIKTKLSSNTKLKMVYAGLLGIAQGIFKLCSKLDYTNIEFHIYGSGAEKDKILNFIKSHPELPIHFHGEVSRQELHNRLQNYDFAIIPLLNRIYGSVPSKIFEYAKLGLPMLYFGGGEGEILMRKYNLGWVSQAGDYEDLNVTLSKISKPELNQVFRANIIHTAEQFFNLNIQLDNLIEKLND